MPCMGVSSYKFTAALRDRHHPEGTIFLANFSRGLLQKTYGVVDYLDENIQTTN